MCQKQYYAFLVCYNFMLNAVEGLRIGSHRIQSTVLVVPPAHPHKKSLKRRKIRNRSCDVYDILRLEFFATVLQRSYLLRICVQGQFFMRAILSCCMWMRRDKWASQYVHFQLVLEILYSCVVCSF